MIVQSSDEEMQQLIQCAINYNRATFIPKFRDPTEIERKCLIDIHNVIINFDLKSYMSDTKYMDSILYDIGKLYYDAKDLKSFFQMIYQVLLGRIDGPRLGSLIKVLTPLEFCKLIRDKLKLNEDSNSYWNINT